MIKLRNTIFSSLCLSLFLSLLLTLWSCGSSSSSSSGTCGVSSSRYGASYGVPTGANVIELTVGGSGVCGTSGAPNVPCGSVTVCSPGTQHCQLITDILFDTGSYGLRIFGSVLTVSLDPVLATNGDELAECTQFVVGSDWGPVRYADVQLANQPAISNLPIQVIDSTYATVPSSCSGSDVSPSSAGYNGILGVGLLPQDCGDNCVSDAGNQMYYSCSGGACLGVAVSNEKQVQNPVALLSGNNNGLIFQFPQVSDCSGVGSITGYAIFGIDTETNNSSSGFDLFQANFDINFDTNYGALYSESFIDSGSNGVFLPQPSGQSLPYNSSSQFYTPSSPYSTSATVQGAGNSGATQVLSFQIGNATSLFSSQNMVFNNLMGNTSSYVDWGFPFFLGRKVFMGLLGKSSKLGTGPYWGF